MTRTFSLAFMPTPSIGEAVIWSPFEIVPFISDTNTCSTPLVATSTVFFWSLATDRNEFPGFTTTPNIGHNVGIVICCHDLVVGIVFDTYN
jgi:hypothetical protein